ncbi:MAG: hypothetical protein E7812_14055 [Phenylobacterium sp.]|nr:MAG: hypothetical protein E7812_14055 [Phenylobacterium sp.]
MSLPLGPTAQPPLPPHAIDDLLLLASSGTDGSRVILALIRRIVEIQDQASEEQLVRLVDEVGALLRREAAAH